MKEKMGGGGIVVGAPLQLIYVSPLYKEWHAASDAVLKGNQRPPGGVACLVEGRKRLPLVGTCQLLFYDL